MPLLNILDALLEVIFAGLEVALVVLVIGEELFHELEVFFFAAVGLFLLDLQFEVVGGLDGAALGA